MEIDSGKKKWDINETVGEWLTRRLKYEYAKLSDPPKEKGSKKIISPIEWLALESGLSATTIYEMKKSPDHCISKEITRERLAFKHNGNTKTEIELLGYYGYPPINTEREGQKSTESIQTKDEENKKDHNLVTHMRTDFEIIQNRLPESRKPCQFCSKNVNYFLNNSVDIPPIDKFSFTYEFYSSTHCNKHYGAIRESERTGFDLRFVACKTCINNRKILLLPVSRVIEKIEKYFKINKSKLAILIGISQSTITRIMKGETEFADKSILRKIYCIHEFGTIDNLRPVHFNNSFAGGIYRDSIYHLVDYTLGKIDEWELISYLGISMELYEESMLEYIKQENATHSFIKEIYHIKLTNSEFEGLTFNESKIVLYFKVHYHTSTKSSGYPFHEQDEYMGSIDIIFTLCNVEHNVIFEVERR